MSKKVILIGVVAIVIIGVASYFYFRKPAPVVTTATTETKTGLSSLLGNLNLSGLTIF